MLLLERPTSVAETVGMGGKAGEWGAFLLLKSFHINRVWVPPFLSFRGPRAVTERRCAHLQLYTVRQSCHREEVCTPTVTHSQAELSQRGGVCTNV